MFPFPDGFIFSERVGRLLPLETICGRLTQRPMSSLAGSPEQLRFTSFAFADLDNLQGLPFEPGFRPRSAPALVRGSEVSHNCCLPRGREIGAEPSTERAARRSRRAEPWEAALDGAVPPTIPKGVMCPNPAPRPAVPTRPKHDTARWNLNAPSLLHREVAGRGRNYPPNFHPQIWTVSELRATQRDSYISSPIPSFPHRNILCHHH